MSKYQKHWSLCLFVLFFCNNIIPTLSKCDEDALYLIRSAASDLVVDASHSKVSIQHFDGYTPQLWKFKRASRPGLFYIINNSTGTVLDVDPSRVVILAKESDSLKQQWSLNSNGRIVNTALNMNLDIQAARYVAGNPVIAVTDNGNEAQNFIVKEKRTCRN